MKRGWYVHGTEHTAHYHDEYGERACEAGRHVAAGSATYSVMEHCSLIPLCEDCKWELRSMRRIADQIVSALFSGDTVESCADVESGDLIVMCECGKFRPANREHGYRSDAALGKT